jgi:hypothetical protein
MIAMRRLLWATIPVLALVHNAMAQRATFPDYAPPRAWLIRISTPNAAGDVTITGAAGAVTPRSTVALVTLDTGHLVTTPAGADGSFSGSLFAPAGSSVLVKSDPSGSNVQRLLREMVGNFIPANPNDLLALPGTIFHVPEPASSGAGVPVSGIAQMTFDTFPVWSLQGTLNAQVFAPGDTLNVQGQLRVLSTNLRITGTPRVDFSFRLEKLAGPDGAGSQSDDQLMSVFMTPTGLPIERTPMFLSTGLVGELRPRFDASQTQADINFGMKIPSDIPAGYYRPRFEARLSGFEPESPRQRSAIAISNVRRRPDTIYLPIIKIGEPAPPHIFWTLLTDTVSNGARGTRALEDQERFGIAPKVLTNPDVVIVPRLNASGQPIHYRLEPFAPSISIGNHRVPDPPMIPFRFPSGGLTVWIQKPDGSIDTIGPAPFVQSRMRTPADADGLMLDHEGAIFSDAYQLTTMDPRFEPTFVQDGLHIIKLEGTIDDVWGNTWTGGGTYQVYVGRPLSLDTTVLPGTPFDVGDSFNPGIQITPPVPGDIQIRFRHAAFSDPARMVDRTITGRANRFGYFQPRNASIQFNEPGEYRVDMIATFRDKNGNAWAGTRTWAGVVAPQNPKVIAHGRRGIEKQSSIGQQWFFRSQTDKTLQDGSHMFFPFHSGDVTWEDRKDSAFLAVTIQDPTGDLLPILRRRAFDPQGFLRINMLGPGTFDERATVGEIPLFSSRPDGMESHLDVSRVDLWAYNYAVVERPLVRVREEITEDQISGHYWGFQGSYMNQIGAGSSGDLTNDFKFQYGGVVLRGPALPAPEYATYGSLFVILPENDRRGGSRTFPPFQGNGGGPTGGPIMTLQGADIDAFVHLTGTRPGSVLEVGDTFSLAGALAPTLPGSVAATVTMPSGKVRRLSGRANHVGYYYTPADDFVVDEPGIYTVDVLAMFGGQTSAGQLKAPFPTGKVLGTPNGRFSVYVVPRDSPLLETTLPESRFFTAPATLDISASAPRGLTVRSGHLITAMPGFVLQTGELSSSDGKLSYRYDPSALGGQFPNLDLNPPADLITVTIFASGTYSNGETGYGAKVIVLHGDELVNPPLPDPVLTLNIPDGGGSSTSTLGSSGLAKVGYAQIVPVSGAATPFGFAIFGFRQNGILVTETAVPASPLIRSGRIYADIGGAVSTGIALANPNVQPANVTFFFTDQNGTNFGQGSFTVAANGQIARLLNEAPFNAGSSTRSTFTFTSSQPISVVALRGLVNERSDFLLTTLPVAELSALTEDVVLPHFVTGGGWSEQIVLVNPTDEPISGTLRFLNPAGEPVSVETDLQFSNSFAYTIPPRSFWRIRTTNSGENVQAGSVRITAAQNQKTPSVFSVFSFSKNGVTVSEAGVLPLRASSAFRLYAEFSGVAGQIGSIATALAIANASSNSAEVAFEMTTLSGASTGLSGGVTVAPNGQTSVFVNQIAGFESLPAQFQGLLRISSSNPIVVTGLRGRYNERGDFLITTTQAVDETNPPPLATVFPHLVDGGGYTTQLVLFGARRGQSSGGTLRFFSQSGLPFYLGVK